MSSIKRKGEFKSHTNSAFSRIRIQNDNNSTQSEQDTEVESSQDDSSQDDSCKCAIVSRKNAFAYIKKLFGDCNK